MLRPRYIYIMLRCLLVLAAISATRGTPCAGDLTKEIGDSWLCDDKCNTCTCNDDGTISATGLCCGPDCPEEGPAPMEPVFEATVVRIAVFFISLILLGCLIICFFMCRKGGSHKASQLVREMEMEED